MADQLKLKGNYRYYYTDRTSSALIDKSALLTTTLETSKSGTVTPDYWKLKTSGALLPVQPYSRLSNQMGVARVCKFRKVAKWNTSPVGQKIDSVDYLIPITTSSYTTLGVQGLFSSERTDADNKAKYELQTRIDGIKWESGVDFGELKETSGMLLGRVKTLFSFAKGFRLTNLKKLIFYQKRWAALALKYPNYRHNMPLEMRNIAVAVSSLFLEFNLGWVPLTGSIEDAINIIAERENDVAKNKGVQGHERFERSIITKDYLTSDTGYNIYSDINTRYTYDVWAGGIFRSEYLQKDTLARQAGLDIVNIPLIFWELTSMSFVVDYFINIQQVLNNLKGSYFRLQPTTCYISRKIRLTRFVFPTRATATQTDPQATYSIQGFAGNTGDSHSQVFESFTRSTLSHAESLVNLDFKLPNLKQALTLCALAAQQIRI